MKTCVRNAFFFIALATSSLDALAALYEIPSTSLASGAYISKASVQGLFDVSAILPADTLVLLSLFQNHKYVLHFVWYLLTVPGSKPALYGRCPDTGILKDRYDRISHVPCS